MQLALTVRFAFAIERHFHLKIDKRCPPWLDFDAFSSAKASIISLTSLSYAYEGT